jgi:hypothetical protein
MYTVNIFHKCKMMILFLCNRVGELLSPTHVSPMHHSSGIFLLHRCVHTKKQGLSRISACYSSINNCIQFYETFISETVWHKYTHKYTFDG